MAYFPMLVDIEQKNCLVVGGGRVALRKVRDLSDFGAAITVVAPEIVPEIRAFQNVFCRNLSWEQFLGEITKEDLTGYVLVIAATGDPEQNHQISKICQTLRIPVNSVDGPADSSFIVPAYLKKNHVVAAFSGGGDGPVIAQYLKQKNQDIVTDWLGEVGAYLGSCREQVKEKIPAGAARKKIYEMLLTHALETGEFPTGEDLRERLENMQTYADTELLVVSFGTSMPQGRELAIGGIETAVKARFPHLTVKRCFTSGMVIRAIEKREHLHINNPEEAFAEAKENGIRKLWILPTHLMDGLELKKFRGVMAAWADAFDTCAMAGPLLETEEDEEAVIEAIRTATESYGDADTAFLLAGHGTNDDANAIYGRILEKLQAKGLEQYQVATIEASPALEDAMEVFARTKPARIVILPFLVVCGNHVLNDLGGEDEDSWKNRLQQAGYRVEVLKSGLGEIPAVQQIYVKHAEKLME